MRLKHVKGSEEAVKNHPIAFKDNKETKNFVKHFESLNLEIGCGKGQFILKHSLNDSKGCYIGVEIYSSVLFRAIEKVEEFLGIEKLSAKNRIESYDIKLFEKLSNLRFLNIDARCLSEYFDKDSVDKIYLNFSDPWPKDRHAKRRLTSDRFLDSYKNYLKVGGTVEFKTDNNDLFEYSLDVINSRNDYELVGYTRDLYNDKQMLEGNIATEYEEKFVALGNNINKYIVRRIK